MSGTWNFQLHPTFWFGMALCDTESYPNVSSTCTPDSNSNIKNSSDPSSQSYIGKHAGTSFMELQLYPPGYTASRSRPTTRRPSAANGFGRPKFQPEAASCSDAPYTSDPMYYATSSEDTRVPWAAHSYNVAFSDEIGHFEYCNGSIDAEGFCHQPNTDLDDDVCDDGSTSLLIHVAGCLDSDVDFNGSSYLQDWPGTLASPVLDQLLHAQPLLFTSPLANGQNYQRTALETDLPAIEFVQGCGVATGANCTNPASGAAYYPFYSTTTIGGTCAWREGGRFMPRTTNLFGGSSKATRARAPDGSIANEAAARRLPGAPRRYRSSLPCGEP